MIVLDRTRPPATGALRPFRLPPFERFELDGGLVLFASPSAAAPLIYLELISPGGARFDPPGKAGLAALTGSMLDEGTSGRTSSEIAAAAERIGGYIATSTDWDSVSLETSVVSPQAGAALGLLGEIAREPTFEQAEFVRQRDRTLAEIRRRRSMPPALASEQFSRALYGHTSFGQQVLGTTASLEAMSRTDVESFYRERIVAAPMTLIATGELDAGELRERAHRALEGLPRRPAEARPEEPLPAASGVRVFLVDRPEAAQTELRIGHVGVARGHSDFMALTVLNSLLGGKFTSRLNLNLRERHGITYSIQSRFGGRLDRGPFTVSLAVANDSVGRAVTEVRREIERLREEPVTADELEDTMSYILGVFPYTVQSLDGLAQRLREIAVYGLPLDYWDRYPAALRALSPDDLLRLAREHLRPDSLAIVAVGPEAELRPQLEPFGEPRLWRPAEQPEPPSGGPPGRTSK